MKLILILILAVTATAQTKWEKLFELPSKGIVFYISNIKMSKKDSTATFDGKMELKDKILIHYFKTDCEKKEIYLLGGEIEKEKVMFDEEIKIQMVESSAIEAAYFRVCGKDG
jgi:spore coat protein CotH